MINTSYITVQNYGSSLLLFIAGATDEEAKSRWLSLFNWGATGTTDSEPEKIAEGVFSCWTTEEKLKRYLFNRAVMLLWDDTKKGSKDGVKDAAIKMADEAYASIATETYRSIGANYDTYAMGIITAEKPDEDFKDSVLSYAFADRS